MFRAEGDRLTFKTHYSWGLKLKTGLVIFTMALVFFAAMALFVNDSNVKSLSGSMHYIYFGGVASVLLLMFMVYFWLYMLSFIIIDRQMRLLILHPLVPFMQRGRFSFDEIGSILFRQELLKSTAMGARSPYAKDNVEIHATYQIFILINDVEKKVWKSSDKSDAMQFASELADYLNVELIEHGEASV